MKKGHPIAIVDWFDASMQKGPMLPEEMRPFITLRTVGWLVRADNKVVTVAMDFHEEDGTYRDIAHIPRVNVLRIKKMRG